MIAAKSVNVAAIFWYFASVSRDPLKDVLSNSINLGLSPLNSIVITNSLCDPFILSISFWYAANVALRSSFLLWKSVASACNILSWDSTFRFNCAIDSSPAAFSAWYFSKPSMSILSSAISRLIFANSSRNASAFSFNCVNNSVIDSLSSSMPIECLVISAIWLLIEIINSWARAIISAL